MVNLLPKAITAQFGLQDKISEVNRSLPANKRMDGLHVKYEAGKGIAYNRKTGEVYGQYEQFDNNKYKFVKA